MRPPRCVTLWGMGPVSQPASIHFIIAWVVLHSQLGLVYGEYWEEMSCQTLAISSCHTLCDPVAQLGNVPPTIRREDSLSPLEGLALLQCINRWALAHLLFWRELLRKIIPITIIDT